VIRLPFLRPFRACLRLYTTLRPRAAHKALRPGLICAGLSGLRNFLDSLSACAAPFDLALRRELAVLSACYRRVDIFNILAALYSGVSGFLAPAMMVLKGKNPLTPLKSAACVALTAVARARLEEDAGRMRNREPLPQADAEAHQKSIVARPDRYVVPGLYYTNERSADGASYSALSEIPSARLRNLISKGEY